MTYLQRITLSPAAPQPSRSSSTPASEVTPPPSKAPPPDVRPASRTTAIRGGSSTRVEELIAQRVPANGCGYEDLNAHEPDDALLAAATAKLDTTGQTRRLTRDRATRSGEEHAELARAHAGLGDGGGPLPQNRLSRRSGKVFPVITHGAPTTVEVIVGSVSGP